MIRLFIKDTRGSVAIPFGIMFVSLVVIAGIAFDLAGVERQKRNLQHMADNASVFAARELAIAGSDIQRIEAVAVSYVFSNDPDAKANVATNLNTQTVQVVIDKPAMTYFPTPLDNIDSLRVTATAQLFGQAGNICLIALGQTAPLTIAINQSAKLTARECAIYGNSTNSRSLRVNPSADISVDQVFLAGGFQGNIKGLSSPPVTDAPPIQDPLADRQKPVIGKCDHKDLIITDEREVAPGVYCGGLIVDGGTVTLVEGTYIIKDGPIVVYNNGSLKGDNVGFYLTGANAKIDFGTESSISLSGPLDGMLAGLLFFADANNPLASQPNPGTGIRGGHVIRSDDARRLVGTIYLPDDKLVIDGETPVADMSEYTVIIAKAFELNNGPNLVIQTDYDGSDVPVPTGVGPMSETSVRILK